MAFTKYMGYYVYHLPPYWHERPDFSLQQDIFDYAPIVGYAYDESPQDYATFSLGYDHLARSKAEIRELSDFFDTMCGRLGKFWFPSWDKDFELCNDIDAEDTFIDVSEFDYEDYFLDNIGTGRYIFIYCTATQFYARKVLSVSEIALESGITAMRLNLDQAIGVPLTQTQVKMVSFLYMGRFDIDELEWEHVSPDVAIAPLKFAEVVSDYPTTTSTSTSTTSSSSSSTGSSTTSVSTSTSTTSTTTTEEVPIPIGGLVGNPDPGPNSGALISMPQLTGAVAGQCENFTGSVSMSEGNSFGQALSVAQAVKYIELYGVHPSALYYFTTIYSADIGIFYSNDNSIWYLIKNEYAPSVIYDGYSCKGIRITLTTPVSAQCFKVYMNSDFLWNNYDISGGGTSSPLPLQSTRVYLYNSSMVKLS